MKKTLQILLSSFLAGVMISIGGIVNLSVSNKYLGALLFSVGLFFIVELGFKLFTGAVGYALSNNKFDNLMLPVIFIGNFIGTFFTFFLIRYTRIYQNINEKALGLVDIKLNDSLISIFILAIFCGMMIYLGVNTYKKSTNNFSKVIAILFCVVVFILSSYEHVIANMFYFLVSGTFNLKVILYLLIMGIGNSLGGILIPSVEILISKLK